MLEAGGKNILVVEDDPVMQAYFKWIIRSIDSTIGVDCVASGEEAVAHLEKAKQKHPFDLIIADQILEGKKTGVDVVRKGGGVVEMKPT
jgi:CheY-like chemotaxis protein